MIWKPRNYQRQAIQHGLQHLYSGLFLDMGLGKTSIVLTIIRILTKVWLEIDKTIVIAPKEVAENVWPDELIKWSHLKGLRMSIVKGTARQRIKALNVEADIYVIGVDNIAWLCELYRYRWPFGLTVLDELSCFKNPSSRRFVALKKLRPLFYRVIGMTGTPVPNGLMDLWAQLFLIDYGERLGKTITAYREAYFSYRREENYTVYQPMPGADKKIHKEISDICISMKSDDYLELPGYIDNTISIELPALVLKKYGAFEKEQLLELFNGDEITALSAPALSNKLAQFSSGAVYDEFSQWHRIHDCKLEALKELIEELNGKNILVFYWFKSTYVRALDYLKKYKPVKIKGKEAIADWNAGKIQVGMLHPRSGGHGLNLQYGGNYTAWLDHTWSLELRQQANKRIYRPGQPEKVFNYNLVCKGTIDQDIIRRTDAKAGVQNALMASIKAKALFYGLHKDYNRFIAKLNNTI